MLVTYDDAMTMREARKVYFEANGFGETGGYDDAWVDFMLGPIPMPFPNTKGRVRAVRYHDLHHILTGYDTNVAGEFEISAWEIGAGCKDFGAAWVLNLSGLAGGIVRAPQRVFRAFVRGRAQRTIYGDDLDAVLDMTVGEARARFTRSVASSESTVADAALFALAAACGTVIGVPLFFLMLPLVRLGLVAHAMRRRETTAAQA